MKSLKKPLLALAFGMLSTLAAAAPAPAGSARDTTPIKVGFSMSLTGPLGPMGKGIMTSAQIWLDEVNARGGLLGRKVEFKVYDDKSNPAFVSGIYAKLISIDKVDVIASPYGTGNVAAALPIVQRQGMVLPALFGLGSNEKAKYERYFSMMPTGPDPVMGWTAGFFEAAMELDPKPKTIALVGSNAEYPLTALPAARRHAQQNGLTIVYDRLYAPTTTDFEPIIRSVQAASPDIVFVASYPTDTTGMIRAAKEYKLEVRMFGGGMIGTQFASIKNQLGPLLNNVVSIETYVPDLAKRNAGVEAFLNQYQAQAVKQSVDPLGFYVPPFAFAQFQVLEQAITGTKSLDHAKLSEYIHTAKFDTVVGPLRFTNEGEWVSPKLLYIQYENIASNSLDEWRKTGKLTILSPADLKNGKLVKFN